MLAYTEAEYATYEVTGDKELKVGENKIVVKVTSLDESTTTEYTVVFEMLDKEEENALQVVGPNVTNDPTPITNDVTIWDKLKANSLVILVYLLALVEFIQVIYLYVKLEKTRAELAEKKTRAGANDNK